jgi:hypothetical protein
MDAIEDDEAEPPNVSIDVEKLHVVENDDAVTLFESVLGAAGRWSSALMQYRIGSDFQKDWKIEAGNWLARARALGFLDDLLPKLQGQQAAAGTRAANDPVHRTVTQWLHQAMTVHYFVGVGWRFQEWEPVTQEPRRGGGSADIDIRLSCPDAVDVSFQVKASGTLGAHDSTNDEHILSGISKAASQLPWPGTSPSIVGVSAQRDWWLTSEPEEIESRYLGTTYGPNPVTLPMKDVGEFYSDLKHVSAISLLDHRRGAGSSDYANTVLVNPWARHQVSPSWFPFSRVLVLEGSVFRWIPHGPVSSYFPTGTRLVADTAA